MSTKSLSKKTKSVKANTAKTIAAVTKKVETAPVKKETPDYSTTPKTMFYHVRPELSRHFTKEFLRVLKSSKKHVNEFNTNFFRGTIAGIWENGVFVAGSVKTVLADSFNKKIGRAITEGRLRKFLANNQNNLQELAKDYLAGIVRTGAISAVTPEAQSKLEKLNSRSEFNTVITKNRNELLCVYLCTKAEAEILFKSLCFEHEMLNGGFRFPRAKNQEQMIRILSNYEDKVLAESFAVEAARLKEYFDITVQVTSEDMENLNSFADTDETAVDDLISATASAVVED